MLSLTDRVKHEELSQTVKDRDVLRTMKRRKANWLDLILHGNYLLIHVTEGKLEQMVRERYTHLLGSVSVTLLAHTCHHMFTNVAFSMQSMVCVK